MGKRAIGVERRTGGGREAKERKCASSISIVSLGPSRKTYHLLLAQTRTASQRASTRAEAAPTTIAIPRNASSRRRKAQAQVTLENELNAQHMKMLKGEGDGGSEKE